MTHSDLSTVETSTGRVATPAAVALGAALRLASFRAAAPMVAGSDRLSGHTWAGAYDLLGRLRSFGWVVVEASDEGLPYTCAWVHEAARASLTYCEWDVSLTVCPSADVWAAELRALSAWYRAPVVASLGFQAPEWDFLASEPDVGAVLHEVWLFAENDGAQYRAFLAEMRPLVEAYMRGTYTAEMGARAFSRLIGAAAVAYSREMRCYADLRDSGRAEWAAWMGDRFIRQMYGMRRERRVDWRGLSAVLDEVCLSLGVSA